MDCAKLARLVANAVSGLCLQIVHTSLCQPFDCDVLAARRNIGLESRPHTRPVPKNLRDTQDCIGNCMDIPCRGSTEHALVLFRYTNRLGYLLRTFWITCGTAHHLRMTLSQAASRGSWICRNRSTGRHAFSRSCIASDLDTVCIHRLSHEWRNVTNMACHRCALHCRNADSGTAVVRTKRDGVRSISTDGIRIVSAPIACATAPERQRSNIR